MKTSELIAMGYKEAAVAFTNQLHTDYKKYKLQTAKEWTAIGARVNYSFYEMEKTLFDDNDISKAFRNLGIDYERVKGKKWFQFWLKNETVKFMNAIKILQSNINSV